MLNDPLAAALTKILNAEKIGKKEVVIRPASKMIKKILLIMQQKWVTIYWMNYHH